MRHFPKKAVDYFFVEYAEKMPFREAVAFLGATPGIHPLARFPILLYNRLMKTEIFTFCDFAQESNGKLTIVGTFDTIIARTFPCVHPQLSVVIRLRFDLWEFKSHIFKIETRDLNGELTMEPLSGKLEVGGAGNATAVSHLVFTFGNLKFQSAGVVNFALFVDDKEITSSPLYIRKLEQRSSAAPEASV